MQVTLLVDGKPVQVHSSVKLVFDYGKPGQEFRRCFEGPVQLHQVEYDLESGMRRETAARNGELLRQEEDGFDELTEEFVADKRFG